MTRALLLLVTAAAVLGGLSPTLAAVPDAIALDGNQAAAGIQTVVIADTGLPEQIRLRAANDELPLELRLNNEEPTARQLQRIGRGNRLLGPIRLQALVEEDWVDAEVLEAAVPAAQEQGIVTARSRQRVGPYTVTLNTTYHPDGELVLSLQAAGGAAENQLRLFIEPLEPVDLAVLPLAEQPPGAVPRDALNPLLPNAEDVVWDSAETMPDGVPELYVGSADAGFSFINLGVPKLPPGVSRLLLLRDEVRRLKWQTTLLAGDGGEARLALRIHPLQSRPSGARRAAWLAWPADLEPLPFPVAGPALFRAADDHAQPHRTNARGYLPFAPYAQYGEMRGNACADMLSRTQDAIALYPMPLFRALAGGPSGLTMRIRPNVRDLLAEYEPSLDRQVLGRALLHDIGVVLSEIAQPSEFVRVTKALKEFGYFEDDGLTECIPYWRADGIVRYGEAFDAANQFNLTAENPAAATYVTTYRRPYQEGKKRGVQVLFVVVNERSESVRERLSVLDVERVFGDGRARPNGKRILANLDYGSVPDDSDWGRSRVTHHRVYHKPGLLDLETRGFVQAASNKGQAAEIYGPLHVPARNVRLVWAYGLPGR